VKSRSINYDEHDSLARPAPCFHDLLLAVIPSLRQQAMALTRHRADAEDLVQASITSALAAHASFEVGTNFRAWTTRILRNRFLSNVRRRRETIDIDDAPAAQLGRSGGQEENIAILELGRHLRRLPARQREILLMISFEGLSYDEASVQLGVAVGTLKARVFRARAQLDAWDRGGTVGRCKATAPNSWPNAPVETAETGAFTDAMAFGNASFVC